MLVWVVESKTKSGRWVSTGEIRSDAQAKVINRVSGPRSCYRARRYRLVPVKGKKG